MKTQFLTNFILFSFTFALPFFVSANMSKIDVTTEFTINAKMNLIEPDEEFAIEQLVVDRQINFIKQKAELYQELEGAESELLIEDWMLSDEYFKFNYYENEIEDESLQVEDWMTDIELWRF